jgi:hypothetical protein
MSPITDIEVNIPVWRAFHVMARYLHNYPNGEKYMNSSIQAFCKDCLSKTGVAVLLLMLLVTSQHAVATPQGAARSSRIQQLHAELLTHPERRSEMTTLILFDRSNTGLARQIASSGVKIDRQTGNLYQVRMPAGNTKAFLDKMPQKVSARLSYPHSTNTITSQGVNLTGAEDMQSLAFDGTGVKIGVIDLGFAALSTSQAANELPPTGSGLTIVDYSGTGTGGTNHGTNVAEIVHE